jgi:hypothetical protein
MNEYTALACAIAISLALSTATVSVICRPLRALLAALCPLESTAVFWTRAAITLLYLMPLWVVLVFGLPDLTRIELMGPGEVARRALAAASFALVAIVIATGLRLSSVRPPVRYDEAVR